MERKRERKTERLYDREHMLSTKPKIFTVQLLTESFLTSVLKAFVGLFQVSSTQAQLMPWDFLPHSKRIPFSSSFLQKTFPTPPHLHTLTLRSPFAGAITRKPAFWSLHATVHFLHLGPPQGEVAREKRKILGFPTLFKSQGPLAQVMRGYFFFLSEF